MTMKAAIPLVSLALCAATFAAVPVEWTADIDQPAARPIAVGLGETIRLVARLVRRGAPYDPGLADAALYLQTNGMGRTWLAVPASATSNELSALYTPAMMGGAPVVSAFLGGRDADGGVYRAFALLRTYHAPGALPGAMPPEAPADLDFSAFTVTNAPWTTPEAVAAAIADALADYTPGGGGIAEETDPVFGVWATTNTLSGDIADLNTVVENDYQLILAANNNASSASVRANAASNTAARALAAAASALDDARAFATNYYALSSTGRVAIDTNGVLAVDVRDTTTNDWSRAWDSAALKAALDANTEQMRRVEQALAHAVAAWADFDASGHPNPDADTIMLNRAYAAIGSGFFWASSGGYHCLCSDGAVAYLAVTNGSLRIFGNSISNYFGLVAGGTVTVGANASGFLVRDGVASITYPYTGGDYPAVWGAATVAGPWTEMTSAVWVTDSGAGTATASFPADQTSFFFKATTTRELSEYFHATVPSYFQGGVKTEADDQSPVMYDSKITVTSGGHTYRIPAELVQ
jgi:hypothetical protein